MVESDPKNLYHELTGTDAGRERGFLKDPRKEPSVQYNTDEATMTPSSDRIIDLDEGRAYLPKSSTE